MKYLPQTLPTKEVKKHTDLLKKVTKSKSEGTHRGSSIMCGNIMIVDQDF